MSLILSAGLEAERLWKRGARAVRNAEPAKIGSIAVEAALRAIGAANVPGRGAGFFPRFPIKKWVSCNPNTRDERSHVASTRRRRPPQGAGHCEKGGAGARFATTRKRGSGMTADDRHVHDHGSELSDMQLRVRALETILTEKGYIDPAALDAIVEACETQIGPHNGARVVARAWVDPDFKRRLLEDASEAANSLGHVSPIGAHLIALENTPELHNLVVCTLCSCYPWEVLGLPPVWYKSAPYRSRAVIDPKGVLNDFGLKLPEQTKVRIWDSTAETRFLVLPMRPEGSAALSEEQLAELVTRDSMVGTGLPKSPADAKRGASR